MRVSLSVALGTEKRRLVLARHLTRHTSSQLLHDLAIDRESSSADSRPGLQKFDRRSLEVTLIAGSQNAGNANTPAKSSAWLIVVNIECRGTLAIQPLEYRSTGITLQRFRSHIGIQNNQDSKLAALAGLRLRMRDRSTPPTRLPRAASAVPRPTGAITAAVKISRTSASVLRPDCAARALSARTVWHPRTTAIFV